MRRFQQILLVLMALVVIAFTLVFILENRTTVSIAFASYKSPDVSLAVLIVIAFVIGMVLAMILSSFILIHIKLKLAMAKKQLNNCKKELAKQNSTALLKSK